MSIRAGRRSASYRKKVHEASDGGGGWGACFGCGGGGGAVLKELL